MKVWVITVARKPLEGTVAANVQKWGTGGINIGGSRIGTADNLSGGAYAQNPTPRAGKDLWTAQRNGDLQCFKRGGAGEYEQPQGRWPANLILQHKHECQKIGVSQIKGGSGWSKEHTGKSEFGQESGWNSHRNRQIDCINHASPDGTETIDQWECVEGCPVKELGEQSGFGGSKQGLPRKGQTKGQFFHTNQINCEYTDEGTAARFFKQVKGEDIEN